MEAYFGAAPVMHLAELLQAGHRNAARKTLAIELAAARDLDLEMVRKRVDDRDADAVQATRGFVDLAVELAARMQRRHDDFERRLLEFRMRIDRNAAAIVGHRQISVGRKLDIDESRVAGDRLVHRIVDDLGEQMVHRLVVGAADIHAGPPPHRLQPFQNLDVGGTVALAAVAGCRALRRLHQRVGRARGGASRLRLLVQIAEKIVAVVHAGPGLRCCESPPDTATVFAGRRRRFPLRSRIEPLTAKPFDNQAAEMG